MKHVPIEPYLKTATHWHLYWVYQDHEFINKVQKLDDPPKPIPRGDDNWKEPYIILANEYSIKYGDVYRYKVRGFSSIAIGVGIYGSNFAVYDIKTDGIEIHVRKDITQKDFFALWGRVKAIQTTELNIKQTKRKSPENSKLIYAIFKARCDNKTYRQIFLEYQNNELNNYENGPSMQFKSEDTLERYYQKYRPDKFKTAT